MGAVTQAEPVNLERRTHFAVTVAHRARLVRTGPVRTRHVRAIMGTQIATGSASVSRRSRIADRAARRATLDRSAAMFALAVVISLD